MKKILRPVLLSISILSIALSGCVVDPGDNAPSGSTASDDATLSYLRVNGATLSDFAKNKFDYTYEVPAGTTDIPQLSYKTSNSNATAEVVQATEIYGSAYVYVLSQDSTKSNVYTVDYVKESTGSGETVLYDLNVNQLTNVSITKQDMFTPNNDFVKNQVGPNEIVLTINSTELAYITIDINANPYDYDELLFKVTTNNFTQKWVFVNRYIDWGNSSTFYSMTQTSSENLLSKFSMDNPIAVTIVANQTTFTQLQIIGVKY